MRLLGSILDPNEREVKQHQRTAQLVGELELEFDELGAAAIQAKADELRGRLADGEDLDDLLPECFALTRVAAKRTIRMRHFDMQLVGGIVLHQGKIAEMKTGEGKTLVASLPLVLNALEGRGVHLVTVNDYLARRDAGWMAPVYHALGLSVGVIVGDPNQPDGSLVYDPEYLDETHPDERLQHLRPASRHEAYRCDITYGTNNQFGFDYLRDNMATDPAQRVQRELRYAIVDEVDSILIDEARTPLIISGPAEDSSELYIRVDKLIPALDGGDFEKDEKQRTVALTESGVEKIEELLRQYGLMATGSLYDLRTHRLLSTFLIGSNPTAIAWPTMGTAYATSEGDATFSGPSRPQAATIPYYQRTRHIYGDLKIATRREIPGRSDRVQHCKG